MNESPAIGLRDLVLFPGCVLGFVAGRPRTLAAIKICVEQKRDVLMLTQKDQAQDHPTKLDDFHSVGVLARIDSQTPREEVGDVVVVATGLSRITATRLVKTEPFLTFEYQPIVDEQSDLEIDEGEIQAIEELAQLVSSDYSVSAITAADIIALLNAAGIHRSRVLAGLFMREANPGIMIQ